MKTTKSCPYCNGKRIKKDGKYFVKAKPHYRQIYFCADCKKRFNHFKFLNRPYISGWDYKLYREVKRLINARGYPPHKKDSRKDKRFLSSRGIIKIVRKKREFTYKAIQHNNVLKLIKRYRV